MGDTPRSIILFLGLLAVQLFLFSQVDLLGYLNPFVYILYVLYYPLQGNRSLFILSAFSMGWLVDIYMNTGGAHAAATLMAAFARPLMLRLAFGNVLDQPGVTLARVATARVLALLFFLVVTHQVIVSMLGIGDLSRVVFVLRDVLYGSVLTFLLVGAIYLLFKPAKP